MRAVRRLLVVTILAVLAFRPAAAATQCTFGGPTPSFQVLRFELPSWGSTFVTLGLEGRRALQPANDDGSWHLAQGVMLVDAGGEIVAYRIESAGKAPARAVVRAGGTTIVDQAVPAAEAPFSSYRALVPPSLPAGTYYAVGFGVGGGQGLLGPNEWRATVGLDGAHACEAIDVDGETFDHDHTDFEGGTQLYAPGAGIAEGIRLTFGTQRSVVLGLIDAGVIAPAGARAATVTFETPGGSGKVENDIRPLRSGAGRHAFEAAYRGAWPHVIVAGVALDL